VDDASVSADVTIRAETPEDQRAIFGVVEAAFDSAIEARLVDLIRDSANFIPDLSLVAELDGTIVGHVMVSFVALHDVETRHRICSLAPLSVAPEFQGRGVGSALVRAVAERVDERGEPLIVLEGSPAYYGRFGFESSVAHGIRITLPEWAPPEAAQVLRLRNYAPLVRGLVVYPAAFDVIDEHGTTASE
jgi:putative acetyltransferase